MWLNSLRDALVGLFFLAYDVKEDCGMVYVDLKLPDVWPGNC